MVGAIRAVECGQLSTVQAFKQHPEPGKLYGCSMHERVCRRGPFQGPPLANPLVHGTTYGAIMGNRVGNTVRSCQCVMQA